jgi:undecaprenyl diphosphate synthase
MQNSNISSIPQFSNSSIPTHLAIIMDGNGRWAKSRGQQRTSGHKKGAEALRRTLDACRDAGIRYLTIYAFSSENWKRPAEEIQDLMQLLRHYLEHELATLHRNNVRLRFIGDLMKLDNDIRRIVDEASEQTKGNNAFNLTVALSYGGRQEIVRAVKKLADAGHLEDITEDDLSAALDTADLPEPDLLIRTGGEQRISNFLLWQSAYTEFYFTDTLWPDFDATELQNALQDYAKRERRYGTTGE